jgi:predicted PurR-regulated permease PerM
VTKNHSILFFLAILTAMALYFCYLLLAPFFTTIIVSVFLAILFYPLHRRIHRHLRNNTISAIFSTIAVAFLIAFPTFLLVRALMSELSDTYSSLSNAGNGAEALGVYLLHAFNLLLESAERHLPRSVASLPSETFGQVARSLTATLGRMAGALAGTVLGALLTIFLLFFFFRDGRAMLRRATVILPLRLSQTRRLFSCVKETLHAIVYGSIAIAIIQGTLTGFSFWIVGIRSPILWGVITAFCSLLPAIGTTIVFIPASSMLIFSGHWIKAIVLIAYAFIVVHPVDNLLRPYLIGERTKLSTLYVFFALVGGLRLFGAVGLILGPIILTLTVALFKFLREEKRLGNWMLTEDPGDQIHPLVPD